jgi:hypothetical protein
MGLARLNWHENWFSMNLITKRLIWNLILTIQFW